jgi:hypothetical protein
MERLVEQAWRERLRVTVMTAHRHRHRPRTVVVHEPPAMMGS